MGKMRGSGRVGIAGRARAWRRAAAWRARGIAGAVLLAGPIGPALATEAPPPRDDKSLYTLPIRRPTGLLRDLSTDRPDMTESPFTVDAGRVQVETNLFGYARSHPEADGTVTSAFGVRHHQYPYRPDPRQRTRRDLAALRRGPGAAARPLAATRSAGVGSVDLVPRSTCGATIPSQRRARPRLPCCRS